MSWRTCVVVKQIQSNPILWVWQYLVNFTGLAGIVNATVYKTEPIFTGLRHGKLSSFLTLQYGGVVSIQYMYIGYSIFYVINRSIFPRSHGVFCLFQHGKSFSFPDMDKQIKQVGCQGNRALWQHKDCPTKTVFLDIGIPTIKIRCPSACRLEN